MPEVCIEQLFKPSVMPLLTASPMSPIAEKPRPAQALLNAAPSGVSA
jgi:hypothetical protein